MNNLFADIIAGAKKHALWMELAKLDLKTKYRGTFFGVLWVVVSVAMKVAIIGAVFSKVLDRPLKEYLLYLGVGIVLWNYISAMLLSGAQSFLKGRSFLSQMRMPQSIFVFQTIYKETIILSLYLCFLFILHLLFFDFNNILATWPWIIFGMALIVLNGMMVIFWIGWLTTKIRDVQQILSNLMIVAFIVTPVLFPVPVNADYKWMFDFNPFYHILAIVRDPIVYGTVNIGSYYIVMAILVMNALISYVFYRNSQRKLILWLI